MGEISQGMKMLECQRQKRIRSEESRDDGIGALPDCLLVEILCRLPCTKDAIRTCTLSKRWAHVWTWLPSLLFSFSEVTPTRTQCITSRSDYALLVDKTLTQCRQPKLKKFEVHTFYDIRYESQFYKWICYAISRNVEELNLEFWYSGRREAEFQFPLLDQSQSLLFANSCFTDLRLVGCMLNPTGVINWKNLRSLCISYLNLDEDLVVNILSGSPQLETLELEYCCGYDWDDDVSGTETGISANAFISLAQCPQLKLNKFKVDTRFHIEFGTQLNSWIRYAIRCNVKELHLSFRDSSGYIRGEFMVLDQIVFKSSCITELRLNGCMVNPVGAISWKNLRSLCISDTAPYGRIDEDLIENILSGSPVLETLELDKCYGYTRLDITSKSLKHLVFSDYWNHDHESTENIVIEINAPNISSLTIQGHMFLRELLLLNVSSLIKADLSYHSTSMFYRGTQAEEEMLKQHIMNLGHVKEITIGFLCSKAVSCMQAKGFFFPSNVKFHGVCFQNR